MFEYSKSYFSLYLETVLEKNRKTLHFSSEFLKPVTGYVAGWRPSQPWQEQPSSRSLSRLRPVSAGSLSSSLVKQATVIPDSLARNLGVCLLNSFLFLSLSQSAARSCEPYCHKSIPFILPTSPLL